MSQTTFSLAPHPPFRLDLTVWALRRRSHNAVDFGMGRPIVGPPLGHDISCPYSSSGSGRQRVIVGPPLGHDISCPYQRFVVRHCSTSDRRPPPPRHQLLQQRLEQLVVRRCLAFQRGDLLVAGAQSFGDDALFRNRRNGYLEAS